MLQRLHERVRGQGKKLEQVARQSALGLVETEEGQQQERSELDEALAGLGLFAEWPDQQIESLYLWPENVPAWNLFQAVGTQWVIGHGGAVGLSYPGVEVVMRKWRIKRRDEQRFFQEIQVMERATLAAWGERKDG